MTTGNSANGTETLTNNITGGGSLTLASIAVNRTGGNAVLAFAGNGDTTVTGGISQAALTRVTKVGNGTLTLGGASSYTGNTTVTGGSLLINGTATTDVTVQTGATLGGSGSTTGSVTVEGGGTYSAGNSIESLAHGNLTLGANASFKQEIDRSANATVSGDLAVVTGTLTLASGNTTVLNLFELGANGSWNANDKITLIGYSTGDWNGGLFTYEGNVLADGGNFAFSGIDWTFDYDDENRGDNFTTDMSGFTGAARYVTMTAVPEPNVAALIGALGGILLLRRRR